MRRNPSFLLPALLLIGCFGGPSGPTAGKPTARPPKPPASAPVGQAPGGGFVSDQGGGLVAANAGRLVGRVRGPAAAIVSDLGASILSNNGGNILSNNGGNILSNNGGSAVATDGGLVGKTKYALLAATALVAAAGADVTAIDEAGMVLAGPVRAGSDGAYRLEGLAPSRAVVFVRATYAAGGQALSLLATAPAPRAPGEVEVALDPAATLVAKHVQAELAGGRTTIERVDPKAARTAADRLAASLDDAFAVAAAVLPPASASRALGALVAQDPTLAGAITATTAAPPAASPPAPAPGGGAPSPGPGGASPTPGAPSASPAAPGPSPTPRLAGIRTLAGDGTPASTGDGGPASAARVDAPSMLALAPNGDLYFSEPNGGRVRRIAAADGTITTVAGTGVKGSAGDGGPATAAQLDTPQGLAVDATGRLYIADFGAHRVREVAGGTIRTIAGTGVAGVAGDGGPPTAAELRSPWALAIPEEGTAARLPVVGITDATTFDLRLARIDPAWNEMFKFRVFEEGSEAVMPGTAGTDMTRDLLFVRAATPEDTDRWYLADIANDRILFLGSGSPVVWAGSGVAGDAGDGGDKLAARFRDPGGLAFAGNAMYVADTGNHRLRRIDAITGVVTTIAGDGTAGFAGDGGAPAAARLAAPTDVLVGPDGRIYIADAGNHRIRVITPP